MIDGNAWAQRRREEEWIDDPSCAGGDLRRALRFLHWIHEVSGAGSVLAREARAGRVLEVACGGGGALRGLVRRGVARTAVGLDRSAPILALARRGEPPILLVRGDGRRLPFRAQAFDTAICHLFFHHLDEPDAVRVLGEMARVAGRVVVLDLWRRRRLYLLVRVLTALVPSRLVRHDGPASVRQSFTPEEAQHLADRLGRPARFCRERFDRWCLVVESGERGS